MSWARGNCFTWSSDVFLSLFENMRIFRACLDQTGANITLFPYSASDLRGPAAALRVAGVGGSDFMAWGTEDELVADLRLAPFTARKLLFSNDPG